MSYPDYIDEIIEYLFDRGIPENPQAAVILGSGLGGFGRQMQNIRSVPYEDIPRFPVTSVSGHEGRLIGGEVNGRQIIAFAGRFHRYEGYTIEQTALPVYLARALGVDKLIISNASGAINTRFSVGDLMIIDDVIRQNMVLSPARVSRHHYNHYAASERARLIASELGMAVQRGTYLYVNGPNYETRAEIRAYRVMGADAVGMSTVPELFEAARLNLKTVALSLICNMACGVMPGKLSHDEVKLVARSRNEDFIRLVKAFIEKL